MSAPRTAEPVGGAGMVVVGGRGLAAGSDSGLSSLLSETSGRLTGCAPRIELLSELEVQNEGSTYL